MKNFRFALASILVAITVITSGAHAQVNRDITSYVLFAYDELIFKGGDGITTGFIKGGNIGVNNPSGGIDLAYATSGTAIMSTGSQAVANTVRADNPGAVFWDLYANFVTPSFNPTILNTGPNAWSPTPIIAVTPTLPFTPGRPLLTGIGFASDVETNGAVTFAPGAYGAMRINDNAVVTFGPGTFDIRDLSIGKGVTFIVDDNTILQIDEEFHNNNNFKFGIGTSSGARIYVGNALADAGRVSNFSQNSEVHAQYFAPTGWLDLGGGSELFGRYWAQRITGDPDDNVTFVPEPSSCVLVGIGLAGLTALVARKRRS